MTWPEVGEILAQIRAVCEIEPLTVETHVRGIGLAERYGFSVYDAMIVASALDAGCATLYTEDLHNARIIEGRLAIRNPFA